MLFEDPLEVFGRRDAARVGRDEISQNRQEGILRPGLVTEHGSEHVNDERALVVRLDDVPGGHLGGSCAMPDVDRSESPAEAVVHLDQPWSVELAERAPERAVEDIGVDVEDLFEELVSILHRGLNEHHCRVLGEGLTEPLVSIGLPADLVPPPLVSHFVGAEQFRGSGMLGVESSFRHVEESVECLAMAGRDRGDVDRIARKRMVEKPCEESRAVGDVGSHVVDHVSFAQSHDRTECNDVGRILEFDLLGPEIIPDGEGHHRRRGRDGPYGGLTAGAAPRLGLLTHRVDLVLERCGELELRGVSLQIVVGDRRVPGVSGHVVGDLELVFERELDCRPLGGRLLEENENIIVVVVVVERERPRSDMVSQERHFGSALVGDRRDLGEWMDAEMK